MDSKQDIYFQEVQYMRHVGWVMILVLGSSILTWWGFIQQIIFGEPWGNNPAPDPLMWLIWIIVGIGFPLLFFQMRLIVKVFADHLVIRYTPLMKRAIKFVEIKNITARTYNPLFEFGGWGILGRANPPRLYHKWE